MGIMNQMKEKFFAEGHTLPTCVNDGCTNKVQVREWKYWSFKSECSSCASARKKGLKRPGVTQHKKEYCENHDSHLGWKCPVSAFTVDQDGDIRGKLSEIDGLVEIWKAFQNSLDLDHLDGDHHNNNSENVKTYCKLCHGKKSLENGDCNSNKASTRKMV